MATEPLQGPADPGGGDADRVVAAARQWLGTPYVHRASCRGAGTDCLGLLRGVWRQVIGAEPFDLPCYSPDWAETGADDTLLTAAGRWLRIKPLCDAATGDVLLFRIRSGGPAKHLGIQSATGAEARFIHAYSGHGVTESSLGMPWLRRLAGRFSLPATTG